MPGLHNFRTVADAEADKFDDVSRAVTTITEPHRMGHEGFMYHISSKVLAMLDAQVDEYLIAIPAGSFPHLQVMQFSMGRGDIDIQSYEDTLTSADGTVVPSNNTNRNSSNTPSMVVTSGPTITDDGDLIHTQWIVPTATGTGLSANGVANIANGEEWVLKPDTKYLIRVTNNSGSTIDYRFEALWYEVDWRKAGQ